MEGRERRHNLELIEKQTETVEVNKLRWDEASFISHRRKWHRYSSMDEKPYGKKEKINTE